ncbi:hypothetical protein [Streptococcus parauberis]|uniref:hypothetical protein n=1 Tax=Streptococcus parauberis TaxID=1348 RepID=UPI000304B4E1|nr:hypothetical protein [Streptococcus parauberis]QBX27366.1 hypothetical protein Javan384_0031 [Streptococcus phage Javan384]UWM90526.1 hypothetical protein N2A94_08475 [Streptococcus parauberis]UWM91271.1 hypothetical protein N2A94_01200 [Streptococcus parauberis]
MSYLGKEVKLTARVIEEERSFLDSSWSNPKLVLELPNGTRFEIPELYLELMADETRYIVVDKRLDECVNVLNYDSETGKCFWSDTDDYAPQFSHKFTRTQLKRIGFEEVFENPNYEVKEVEE